MLNFFMMYFPEDNVGAHMLQALQHPSLWMSMLKVQL